MKMLMLSKLPPDCQVCIWKEKYKESVDFLSRLFLNDPIYNLLETYKKRVWREDVDEFTKYSLFLGGNFYYGLRLERPLLKPGFRKMIPSLGCIIICEDEIKDEFYVFKGCLSDGGYNMTNICRYGERHDNLLGYTRKLQEMDVQSFLISAYGGCTYYFTT